MQVRIDLILQRKSCGLEQITWIGYHIKQEDIQNHTIAQRLLLILSKCVPKLIVNSEASCEARQIRNMRKISQSQQKLAGFLFT